MTAPRTRLLVASALAVACLLPARPAEAQNFDETWKEFLVTLKVSNISALVRPDARTDRQDYLKYLLMNMNSAFCQSELERAETLQAEINTFDAELRATVDGFPERFAGLERNVAAYHTVDELWRGFLAGQHVSAADVQAIEGAKRLCEKQTLAKQSYMAAYDHLCGGDLERAAEVFETRTLRLAEKTSLRIEDVDGLAPRVADMKAFFAGLPALEDAWRAYVATGVSPGVGVELPTYACYPAPKVKELVLRGLADVCGDGVTALAQVDKLLARAGTSASLRDLAPAVEELREAVDGDAEAIAQLDAAWAAFLKTGSVDASLPYGYTYCGPEPLIRAYLLDGYGYVCQLAQPSLAAIDSLQRELRAPLAKPTREKIRELGELRERYRANGTLIEEIWAQFVAAGDTLLVAYDATDQYCDYVEEVKDWTMRGLSGDCEEGKYYLERIDAFTERFDFRLYEDLECRVRKLRVRLWDCRHAVLRELAELEGGTTGYEARLAELMAEYDMPERPEGCL